ncbi:hypothetical protein SASPL_133578 [Salvia splendens]|uniref:Pentatricopeptide repeat-containing protein n=1 Tax=Salvia splendens TaxID=180675 RepID=A0A8X8X422_SALSN|nr:pentatricopeptide repeat-containing protein At4g02750-like [Salvia splendens]KAG6405982.1 hypothetical protein SASPL_133578 [Salvia splendens]
MPLSADLISFDHALKLFNDLPNPNLISHNTLIKCSIGKSHKIAAVAYNRMRESGILANRFTFTFLLSCFASFQKLRCGETVHGHVLKIGYSCSVFVMNNLLDFYSKCAADLGEVVKVFDEMSERDAVSWNTMIRAYMSCGKVACAMRLFEAMPGKNLVSWNIVVSGLVKGGRMELADEVFQRMPERNSVSWNTMISACKLHGNKDLLEFLNREILEQEPNNANYLKLITDLSSSAGQWQEASIFRVAAREQGRMVTGCSSIHVGESVHEFVAKDTSHPQRKEVYKALRSLNRQMKPLFGVNVDSTVSG